MKKIIFICCALVIFIVIVIVTGHFLLKPVAKVGNDTVRMSEFIGYSISDEQHILERMAKKIAREVAATNIEVKLDSMNSYERRIIHNVLANHKKVYTESEGEEPNRYVVIKPKKLSDE